MVVISTASSGYIFAAEEKKEKDCANIENLQAAKKVIYSNWDYKIVDENVYQKSLNNLEIYCNWDTSVLETNIFINQLLDLSFRKLDWLKWLSYWVQFDEKAQQRREYLNWIQQNYETPPWEIYNEFMQAWWEPASNTDANNESLYWKFLLACKELKNIYPKVKNANTFDGNKLTVNAFEIRCNTLVQQRYSKELQMVKKVMFQNYYHITNKTLYKALNQTFWKKLWDLYDKVMHNVWVYEHIVRRYMHVTDANE